MNLLDGFDFTSFWRQSEYANSQYVDGPPASGDVSKIEGELGVKLPAAYVQLARRQNGGIPRHTLHRVSQRTTWSSNHIAISGIYSIGRSRPNSLCGDFGSEFWIQEWGYPRIGVYFADCPSAGHDMLCLDYSACGPAGEPRVVHVDQERDYKVTLVAPNFAAFIRGLEDDDAFNAA